MLCLYILCPFFDAMLAVFAKNGTSVDRQSPVDLEQAHHIRLHPLKNRIEVKCIHVAPPVL